MRYKGRILRDRLSQSIHLNEIWRVIDLYEAISSSYSELYSSEQISKYTSIFNSINLSHLRSKGSVLSIIDIGCGIGDLAHFLSKNLRTKSLIHYIGLDISPSQLTRAKMRKDEVEYSGFLMDLIAGDLAFPPFRDILSTDVLVLMTVIRCSYDFKSILEYYERFFKPQLMIFSIICDDEDLLKGLREFLEGVGNLCRWYRTHEVICVRVGKGDERK